MKLSASSLLAGIILSSLFGIANAGESGTRVEIPLILGSINTSGYQLLGEAEMTEVTGSVISNGTYNVYDIINNSYILSGTVTISDVPGEILLHKVSYDKPSTSPVPQRNSFVATGLEQRYGAEGPEQINALGMVWEAGAQATGLAVYTLSPSGWLYGHWIVQNATGSITKETPEILVPSGSPQPIFLNAMVRRP